MAVKGYAGGAAGTAVTSVTGTAPISSTGGTTPAISVADATTLAPGVVQPDGTTITINGSGVISAASSAPAFSTVTAGTNTTALVIGTGGSLGVSGSGTISATSATTATTATSATNLTGTVVGSIAYQSASGTTGYLSDVATGSILISGGINTAPSYSTTLPASVTWPSPGAIGGTTPAAGAFTTIQGTGGAGTSVINAGVLRLNFNASTDTTSLGAGSTSGTVIIGGGSNALTITSNSSGTINLPNLAWSGAAPTISSGFGSGASVTQNNGTASFSINVGTGGSATSGVIGLPTAAHGWSCYASDTGATPTGRTEPTASTTNSVTLTNYSRTTGVAVAWTASEIIQVTCWAN